MTPTTDSGKGAAPAQIVSIVPTHVWIENGPFGERAVMVRHEGFEAFEYAVFNYGYGYTDNGTTHAAATKLAMSLGAVEPIEYRYRDLPVLAAQEAAQQPQAEARDNDSGAGAERASESDSRHPADGDPYTTGPAWPPAGHPLRKLGDRLAQYLDDDKFNECEALLLQGWDHDRIDRKTGQHWREDSSLEVWFPLTAERLAALAAQQPAVAPVAPPLFEEWLQASGWLSWSGGRRDAGFPLSALEGAFAAALSVLPVQPAEAVAQTALDRVLDHLGMEGRDRSADPVAVIQMIQSWEQDSSRRGNLLEEHLNAVIEVARTWQPEYATVMDRATLEHAAFAAENWRAVAVEKPQAPLDLAHDETSGYVTRLSLIREVKRLRAALGLAATSPAPAPAPTNGGAA